MPYVPTPPQLGPWYEPGATRRQVGGVWSYINKLLPYLTGTDVPWAARQLYTGADEAAIRPGGFFSKYLEATPPAPWPSERERLLAAQKEISGWGAEEGWGERYVGMPAPEWSKWLRSTLDLALDLTAGARRTRGEQLQLGQALPAILEAAPTSGDPLEGAPAQYAPFMQRLIMPTYPYAEPGTPIYSPEAPKGIYVVPHPQWY